MPQTLPKSVIYYGSEKPLPPRHRLKAGPLDLIYECGGLRYITFGDREVVRGIYCAVRDQNWATVLPQLHDERIEARDDSFQINFGVDHVEAVSISPGTAAFAALPTER